MDFREEIFNLLNGIAVKGADIVSVVFPPLGAEVFSQLAEVDFEQKFFFENRALGIAELGFGVCASVVAGAGLSSINIGGNSALNFFCAIPFCREEKPLAYVAKWQISLCDNVTKIVRNLDLRKENVSPESLFDDYQKLLLMRGGKMPLPQFSLPREVGGDWYFSACKGAVKKIADGELKKVVLARARDFLATEKIPVNAVFPKLRERYAGKNCTVFLFSDSSDRAFIGATPEMLVRVSGGILETEAIAGSLVNDGSDFSMLAKRFLADDKERREHRAVVDFIAEKLYDAGLLPDEIPEIPDVLVLPNVLHLRTPIRAKLPEHVSVFDVLKRLHPTPAMCGVPAERAYEHILATEPFPRENFAGPLGFYRESGDGFFAVGIRCAKISGTLLRVYAGSGLVSGSVPEREFSEIDAKFSAICALLSEKI